MNRFLFSSLAALSCYACQPTTVAPPPASNPAPTESAARLSHNPTNYNISDWVGTYQGTMFMYSINQPDKPQEVKLKLEILTTNDPKRWTWRASYESSQYGNTVKDYSIAKPDSLPPSEFWMDEGNDLLIHEAYLNNTFYSYFTYNSTNLIGRFELLPSKQILYEVFSAPSQARHKHVLPDSSVVTSYPVVNVQKAILNKE